MWFLISVQLSFAETPNIYVSQDVYDKGVLENAVQNQSDVSEFSLFTHGRSGELFINNQWKNAEAIVDFLSSKLNSDIKHVNIYGCEFGKGVEGIHAVNFIEEKLGITVSASDNITGNDGDWILEVGSSSRKLMVSNYPYNLACGGVVGGFLPTDDLDGDGICNNIDLDDDNDGISDAEECGSLFSNEYEGTFGTSATYLVRNLQSPLTGAYTYKSRLITDPYANVLGAGNYAVMNGYVNNLHTYWSDMVGHTTGDSSDMFLAVNGSNSVGIFFSATFYLAANTTYNYGLWAANANPTASGATSYPANLGYKLIKVSTGVTVDSGSTGNITTSHIWTQSSGVYTTGSVTEQYKFQIYNISVGAAGNDFAIDDIYFDGCGDYDGDGIKNFQDLDSDNDGCPDALEGSKNLSYSSVNVSGVLKGGIDGSGIPSSATGGQLVGTSQNATQKASVCSPCNPQNPLYNDFDGDGVADDCDLDDDNDGILDSVECQGTVKKYTIYTFNRQSTTFASSVPLSVKGAVLQNLVYTQSIPLPSITYSGSQFKLLASNIVPDSYGNISIQIGPGTTGGSYLMGDAFLIYDGTTFTVLDNGSTGTTYTGTWGTNASISGAFNSNERYATSANYSTAYATYVFSGLTAFAPCDTDGDGIPNYLDRDSDNDGCPDAIEGGGDIRYSQLKSNNSISGSVNATTGVPLLAGTGQTVGSSTSSSTVECCTVSISSYPDYDGDGLANQCDLDNDNDGIPDSLEGCTSHYTIKDSVAMSTVPLSNRILLMFSNSTNSLSGTKADNNYNLTRIIQTPSADISLMTHPDSIGVTYSGSSSIIISSINSTSLAQAKANKEYLEFSFTTKSSLYSAYIDYVGFLNRIPQNGFSVTYSISDDGFATSNDLATFVEPINAGVDGSDAGRENEDISDYALKPSTTYTVRLYFYSVVNRSPVTPAAYTIEFDDYYLLFNACYVDTDGDGIPDYLDLDADGDGCPDAIEGSASNTGLPLVSSSLPGGNSGTGYNGTTNLPVNINLGTTSNSSGYPTALPSGQGIGTSQNKSVKDSICTFVDLQVKKTVTPTSALVGTNVTFTMVAKNNGPDTATLVKVFDTLPSGYTYVSNTTPTKGTWSAPVWSIGKLSPGDSAVMTITATLNATGNFVNQAIVDGYETDTIPLNDTSRAQVRPLVIISGTVFNDVNGNTIINSGETGTTAGANLYVYLIDAGGIVIDSAKVKSDGTYSIKGSPNTAYTIKLSTEQQPIGTNTNVTTISTTLPSGWANIGENGNNNTGTGDGTPNGILPVTTGTTSVTQQNFAIAQYPIADSKVYTGINADSLRFTATGNSTYPYAWALNSSAGTNDGPLTTSSGVMPGLVSGNDPVSGRIAGQTGSEGTMTFVSDGKIYDPLSPTTQITSTVLMYGSVILKPNPLASDPSYTYWNSSTSQYLIPNFNASNLSVWLDTAGQSGFLFNYSWINASGLQSQSVIYSVTATKELSILPVTWVSFTGRLLNNSAYLSWKTATEHNNSGFEVQYSRDGIHFEDIGWVEGNGTTGVPHDYSFIHDGLVSGEYYYRLKQIDYDGVYEYSEIITLEVKSDDVIQIYPTPATSEIFMKNIQNYTRLSVYNSAGALMRVVDLNGESIQQLDISNLSKGNYYLEFVSKDGESKVLKTMIQ